MLTVYALLCCGGAAACALWSLVDAVTSSKYVCMDNSDPYITASRALDWGQVLTAVAITTLAISARYKTQMSADSTKSHQPHRALNTMVCMSAACTVVIIFAAAIIGGSVCDGKTCISRSASDAATTNEDPTEFILQSLHMIGDDSGKDTENYACNGFLSPAYFAIPENYCRANLNRYCPSLAGSATATSERCLVYVCNDLIPGTVARYALGQAGLLLQLVACVLLLHANSGTTENSTDPGMSATTETADASLSKNLHPTGGNDLRRRRYYSNTGQVQL